MALYAFGWPKALATGCQSPIDNEIIYTDSTGDYLVVVGTSTLQIWNSGQHRIKLGELVRDQTSVSEEGANFRGHWCNNRRILAVVTEKNHLHFYGLHTGRESVWRAPNGQDIRSVSIYLQNDIDLSELSVPGVADLSGDGKSLLVAATNGDLVSFSWQGKPRGRYNPLSATDIRRRASIAERSASVRSAGSAQRATSDASESLFPTEGPNNSVGVGGLLLPDSALDLHKRDETVSSDYLPSPAQLQASSSYETNPGLRSVHYLAPSRLLAEVTQNGACAVVRAPEPGLETVEGCRLLRWVHHPTTSSLGKAVAAAIQPGGQMLAIGFASGAVGIYSISNLLAGGGGAVLRSDSGRSRTNSDAANTVTTHIIGGALHSNSGGAGGNIQGVEPLRILSLTEWGHTSDIVGAAASLRWSPDGSFIAVGYRRKGLSVWTPSGCRLMSSLRQSVHVASTYLKKDVASEAATGLDTQASEELLQSPFTANQQGDRPVLEGGISCLTWTASGYSLITSERTSPQVLYEVRFARSLRNHHRVSEPPIEAATSNSTTSTSGTSGLGKAFDGGISSSSSSTAAANKIGPSGIHVMLADDRLLLIMDSQHRELLNTSSSRNSSSTTTAKNDPEAGSQQEPELLLQHVRAPAQYVDGAYPLMTGAISADGRDVAVAGTRGLALYGVKTARWRLFGDAMQERRIRVGGLGWLPGGVLAVCAGVAEEGKVGPGGQGLTQQLMLFPKHHLDMQSVLANQRLSKAPIAMDTCDKHIVLAFAPLEIRLYQADLSSLTDSTPKSSTAGATSIPGVTLTAIRELSILGVGPPLKEIVLLPSGVNNKFGLPANTSSTNAQKQLKFSSSQTETSEAAGQATSNTDTAGGEMKPALRIATGREPIKTPPSDAIDNKKDDGPARCVILRAGGTMGVLDLQNGSEMFLSDGIEAFWLPVSGQYGTAASLHSTPSIEDTAALSLNSPVHHNHHGGGGIDDGASKPLELPWWTYGARGMQLWFPSTLSDPLSPKARAAAAGPVQGVDPELEFDPEVYPIGVSLSEVSIIGITQRVSRNPSFASSSPSALCFHPLPESQPVLPCLLRRLLEQDRFSDALELASRHSQGPHFARSLEWLLFTTLEADADASSSASARSSGRKHRFSSSYASTLAALPDVNVASPRATGPAGKRLARAGPLLLAAARLLRQFVQCPEVVVSVARKTDAQLWPALFAAVGSPTALCEELMRSGALQSAACSLLLVDHVEGPSQAHGLALRLLRAALTAGSFDLAADLLRFVVPPGEESELQAVLAGGNSLVGRSSSVMNLDEQASKNNNNGSQQQPIIQEQQQQQAGIGSWLWSMITGPAPPINNGINRTSTGASTPEPSSSRTTIIAQRSPLFKSDEPFFALTPATDAWRMVGLHAWKLLDSGALRELADLGRAIASVHGGLANLLASSAPQVKMSQGHMTASAAAMASALFVASNEFANADVDVDTQLAAHDLLDALVHAGCINHATALSLVLQREDVSQQVEEVYPEAWDELHVLIANDVHLCSFTSMMSPPSTPLMLITTASLDSNYQGPLEKY